MFQDQTSDTDMESKFYCVDTGGNTFINLVDLVQENWKGQISCNDVQENEMKDN